MRTFSRGFDAKRPLHIIVLSLCPSMHLQQNQELLLSVGRRTQESYVYKKFTYYLTTNEELLSLVSPLLSQSWLKRTRERKKKLCVTYRVNIWGLRKTAANRQEGLQMVTQQVNNILRHLKQMTMGEMKEHVSKNADQQGNLWSSRG